MSPANAASDRRSGWSQAEGPGRKIWGGAGPVPITPYLVLMRPMWIGAGVAGQISQIGFICDGDLNVSTCVSPPPSWNRPTVGPLHPATGYSIPTGNGLVPTVEVGGVNFGGTGTIDFNATFRPFTACAFQGIQTDILVNGVVVLSNHQVTDGHSLSLMTFNEVGFAVSTGDVMTFRFVPDVGNGCLGIYGDGTDDGGANPYWTPTNVFEITGGALIP